MRALSKRSIPLIAALSIAAGCQKKAPTGPTFAQAGDAALKAMEDIFLSGEGWLMCSPNSCFLGATDVDWGADSMTDALYFRWSIAKDPSIPPMLAALNAAGPTYGSCTATSCLSWADVPQWDSIAASREFDATGDPSAQSRAKSAFDFLDTSTQFALGACPAIYYQQPLGGTNQLKTLETDSNYIKAALLLYQSTMDDSYLTKAAIHYGSVRQYFLDPTVPLYTALIIDDGTNCTQIPRRFFASVNGNMIWSGLALAAATGQASYRSDAIASATAFAQNMNDAAGVFADMAVECDVVEPMVEAMYELATTGNQSFARDWLLTNAKATSGDLSASGAYGRFFDGPPQTGMTTGWQTNGGFALQFAAEALAPTGTQSPNAWSNATFVTDEITTLPSTLKFTGSAVALVGTLAEQFGGNGHAKVLVDGVETFDQSGIWQNEGEIGEPIPDSILFAWRWSKSGSHTLTFQPGDENAKEGGPFLHVQGYYLVK